MTDATRGLGPFTDPTVAAWFERCHERTKRHLCERRRNLSPCEMLLSLHEDLSYFDRCSHLDAASYQAREAVCDDALRLRAIVDRGQRARARNLVRYIRERIWSPPRTVVRRGIHAVAKWESQRHAIADRIDAKYLREGT